jgi:hypothetical protein
MNKSLTIGLIVVLIVLLGAGAVWAFSDKGTGFLGMGPAATTTPEQPTVCTLEAKICPDGSSVGRTGPNCEFAACPGTTGTPEKEKDTAALGERIYKFGVHITPLEVVEDSRCPAAPHVQCIQAGTVRLKARLEDGTRSEVVTFDIGSPISFGNKHVALMSVLPLKTQTPIAPANYRFTFSVAYGMGGDAPDGPAAL